MNAEKKNKSNARKDDSNQKSSFKNLLHYSFEVGILIKGIDGTLEVLGGFLMLYLNPARLDRIVIWLTQHEIAENPHDLLMNLILKTSQGYTGSSQLFGVLYLMSHGLVKVILVSMLWRKNLWAYPLSIIFIFLFILYQLYRYSYSHSIWMIVLTIFDIGMILLTWIEYKRIKENLQINI